MAPQQVAAFLQVGVSTLKARRAAREGPRFSRVGRSISCRYSDVDAWVESVSRKQHSRAA